MPSSKELVDWAVAKRVGRAIAGGGPSVQRVEAERIVHDFHDHVDTADRLIREYTSLKPGRDPGPTAVLSRAAWLDVNIDALRSLLRPVADRLAAGLAGGGVSRRAGRMVIGVQIGIVLGYISQKVLGQYDLVLATGEPGRVYFVGPNIVAAERRSNLNPHDFRLWIALHEVTHRTQFLAVPWLRDRVAQLIEQYLSGIKLDRDRLRESMARIREIVAAGPDAWQRANVVQIFLSGEQREAIDRMQSLMSVVEGHGNFVMDGIAAAHIPSHGALRDALDRRRESTGSAERAFQRLIALDMKYEQYAVGQRFFDAVAAEGGMDAVNRVWDAPENLPGPGELQDPAAWIRRVAPQPALFDDPSP